MPTAEAAHVPTDSASLRAKERADKKAAKAGGKGKAIAPKAEKAKASKPKVIREPKPPYKMAVGTVDDGKYVFEKLTFENAKDLTAAVKECLDGVPDNGLKELLISLHVKPKEEKA